MASGQLTRAEALACQDCLHACHVMLFADTKSQLFGKIPIRHIILMQMRFDGLLGFPGGLVNPAKETLEAGLSRELAEEVGVALPISEEDRVISCYAPALPSSSSSSSPSSPSSSSSSSSFSSRLITHFYVKKIEEEKIREVERATVFTATDYGHEVLGMVRVPLYTLRKGGGLPLFLSHSFIGNSRTQLIDSLLRLNMVTEKELHKALTLSLKTHTHSAEDLKAAFALTKRK